MSVSVMRVHNEHTLSPTPEKPTALQGDLHRLPPALAPLTVEPRWVVWRWELNDKGKWTKVPYQAERPNLKAASNRPETWSGHTTAVRAVEDGNADGIGYMLHDGDVAAYDIDNCRDPATGHVASWAWTLVDEARSYTEITVSGTGLRIIGQATGDYVHRKQPVHDGSVETYRRATRFIVVTGLKLEGSYDELTDLDAMIDRTVEDLDAKRKSKSRPEPFEASTQAPTDLLDLIRTGAPVGRRSERFFHVVGGLKDLGYTVDRIEDLLAAHPSGIAEKYQGRLRDQIEKCFDKAESRTRSKTGPEPDSPPRSLNVIDPSQWEGQSVPPREWHVQDLIPHRNVTLLYGDGATGKSTLALQLAAATAASGQFLGLPVTQGRVLYLSAEDDAHEIHRRLHDITTGMDLRLADLHNVRVISLLEDDEDCTLAAAGKNNLLQWTALWEALCRYVEEWKPRVLILDPLADLFAGEENNRAQARQFISKLRSLAFRRDLTVVLLAHPSLSGMATGTGTSGNTGWSNSVRSRLYFRRVTTKDGEEIDPDVRTLTTKKANYAAVGAEIMLRWKAGMFVREGDADVTKFDKLTATVRAESVFLQLLHTYEVQGRRVSANRGPTYAPTEFAAHPDARGVSKSMLEAAMERLLQARRIAVQTDGPPSKRRAHLVTVADGKTGAWYDD